VNKNKMRGMMYEVEYVGVYIGVKIEYDMGEVMKWKIIDGISEKIKIMEIIIIILMNENKKWILNNGRKEEEKEEMKKLRGEKCDVEKEMDDILNFDEKNNV
jgi:hypothetical protein